MRSFLSWLVVVVLLGTLIACGGSGGGGGSTGGHTTATSATGGGTTATGSGGTTATSATTGGTTATTGGTTATTGSTTATTGGTTATTGGTTATTGGTTATTGSTTSGTTGSTTSGTTGSQFTVGPAGGTFDVASGAVHFVIPPNAVSSPTTVTVNPIATAPTSRQGRDYIPDTGWTMTPVSFAKPVELTLGSSGLPSNGKIFSKQSGSWFPLATFVDRDARKATAPSVGNLSDFAVFAYPNGDWDWSTVGTFWFNGLTVSLPDGGLGDPTRTTPAETPAYGPSGDWTAVPHGAYSVSHSRYSVVVPGRGAIATIQIPPGSVPDANWGLLRTFQKVVNQGTVPFIPVLDHSALTATTSINEMGHLGYAWSLAYFSHPIKVDWSAYDGSSIKVYSQDGGLMQSSLLSSLQLGPLENQGIGVDGGFRLDDHAFVGNRVVVIGGQLPTSGSVVSVDASSGNFSTLLTINADAGWYVSRIQAMRSSRPGSSTRVGVSVRFVDVATGTPTQVHDRLLSFVPGNSEVDILKDETKPYNDVTLYPFFVSDVGPDGAVLAYVDRTQTLFSGGTARVIAGYNRDESWQTWASISPSGNRILYFNLNGDVRVTDVATGQYFQPYPAGVTPRWAHNDNYLALSGPDSFSILDIRTNNSLFSIPKTPSGSGFVIEVR